MKKEVPVYHIVTRVGEKIEAVPMYRHILLKGFPKKAHEIGLRLVPGGLSNGKKVTPFYMG